MLIKKSMATIFLIANLVSCCSMNSLNNNTHSDFSQEEKMLASVRESVVKITTLSEVTLIDKVTKSPTYTENHIHSGSGSIVGQTTTGTMILTAGHVCDMPRDEKQMQFLFPWYKKEIYNVKTVNNSIVMDINEIKYVGSEIILLPSYDTCIIITSKIPHPALPLSSNLPRDAQKAYMLGFPMGIWENNYVPAFSGFYAGTLSTQDGLPRAAYTIPTYPGVSGGPIVNLEGNIIGMIHSYMSEFNNLGLAATQKQIQQTLEMANSLYYHDKTGYDIMMLQMPVIFPGTETSTVVH